MPHLSPLPLPERIHDALGRIKFGSGTARDHIAGISEKEGTLIVALSIADGQDPKQAEPARRAIEDALLNLQGVTSARVVLTQERGAPTISPGAHAAKRGAILSPIDLPEIRFRLAIASGKGGVGKSTLAANIAIAAAAQGLRVGLLDADIYGPSVPMLFGLRGQRPQTGPDKRVIPLQAHGVAVMSIGFLVDEDQAMIWRGPMVQGALVQLLRDVCWGPLDLLVIDMPPGTGDAPLTLCQQAQLSGAVVVATPQDMALVDARKGLAMFSRLNIPVMGLVENMSGFRCPHCDEVSAIFGQGGVRAQAEKLGVDLLAEIPLDPALRAACDMGVSLAMMDPQSPTPKIYAQIARKVWEKLSANALPKCGDQ